MNTPDWHQTHIKDMDTGCRYCYVPDVLRMNPQGFDAGAIPRPDFPRQAAQGRRPIFATANLSGQVMLSFTTDPYHTGDTTPHPRHARNAYRRTRLRHLHVNKRRHPRVARFDLFRPKRDAFASTLTSLDEKVSKKWERNAALRRPHRRAAQISRGRIFTWVSLEPTLDIDASLAIVKATHPFIDLYKVGRVNYLPMTKTTDWQDYTLR